MSVRPWRNRSEVKRRSGAATALVLAAVLGLLLVNAQPSLADSEWRIPGASASFQSYGEKFRLWDTACDGKSVYIIYQRLGASKREIRFSDGCGLMGLYDRNFAEGQPIAYKVCVNVVLGSDRCSNPRGPADWILDKT